MRFMVMIKATLETGAGVMPSEELLARMDRYNDELARAGVLLAGEGLQPSANGARVRFSGGRRSVVDGPFSGTRGLVAGFWLIQAKSLDEAIEWVKRCPDPSGSDDGAAEIEIRQVAEADGFGERLTR